MNEFDLSNIQSSRAATFNQDVGLNTVLEKPVGFILVGTNSEQYAAADREVRAFNIQSNTLRAKNKVILDASTEEGAMDIAKATETHRMIYLKHCVIGWYGFSNGEVEAEFTQEELLKVLAARPLWAERLIGAIENEGNFVKG